MLLGSPVQGRRPWQAHIHIVGECDPRNSKELFQEISVFARSGGAPDPCMTKDDMDEEHRSAGREQMFSYFVVVDDDVPTSDPQTVADIVAVLGDRDKENEDEPETPPAATFARAIAALDVLRSYFDTKDNPAAEEGLQVLQKELFLAKGQGVCLQKLMDIYGK